MSPPTDDMGPREKVRLFFVSLLLDEIPFRKAMNLAMSAGEQRAAELDSASTSLRNALLGSSTFFDHVEATRAMRDADLPEDWNYVKALANQIGTLSSLRDRRPSAERKRLMRDKIAQIAATAWMAWEVLDRE